MAFLSETMTWSPGDFVGSYANGHVHPREAIAYIRGSCEAYWAANGPTHAIRAVHVSEVSRLYSGTTILVDEAADSDNMLLNWEWLCRQLDADRWGGEDADQAEC